jgi:hypothetical protein
MSLNLLGVWLAAGLAGAAGERELTVEQHPDKLLITSNDKPVATYVFRDTKILRPYFAHVHAPSGEPVTREHPPRPEIDAIDHDTMHPGIWLAFGDLGGGDFWRNKGRVELVEFAERLLVRDNVATWAANYRYVQGERNVCTEVAKHSIRSWRDGWLITLDSEFCADEPLAFGDQEEMGLGIRLATPLAVKGGSGTITSSEGRRNEKEVWGQKAAWCDYSGAIDGRRAGLVLLTHPDNFRASWMHARDYGLLVANPFGQRAFTRGKASRVEVQPGKSLRLRFAVFAYATKDENFDPPAAYDTYLQIEPVKK